MADSASDFSNSNGAARLTRGGLLLRDSFVFLTLLLITGILYGITFLLFRSFESHREDLGREWAAQGQTALGHGQPDVAVSALRAALSYTPDEHADQLLLAEALAASGRTEEASNYFLNLWTARPGDGFINLQLARIARKRGQTPQAIDYYRAAIYGDWQGDGLQRRRDTRLELSDYFVTQGNLSSARNVLLVLAGNAPDNAPLNLLIGDKLVAVNDLTDALTYYERAIVDHPGSFEPLAKAGITAYGMGDYEKARTLLARAEREAPGEKSSGGDRQLAEQVSLLEHNANRLLELTMSRELPAAERARHIRMASTVAESRLKTCTAQATLSGAPSALPVLNDRWKAAIGLLAHTDLPNNATAQDNLTQLIFDTEAGTLSVCGAPPAGDDDLLLLLARTEKIAGNATTGANP